jgi:hypothetical protein
LKEHQLSVRPITDTLRLLQGGAFLEQCSEALSGIVKAVDETGKAGKLTITIDIKKAGGAVSVLAQVSDKTPEEAPDADLFWPTVEGNLSLQNPNQRNLDLQQVNHSRPPVVNTVDMDTGEIKIANA